MYILQKSDIESLWPESERPLRPDTSTTGLDLWTRRIFSAKLLFVVLFRHWFVSGWGAFLPYIFLNVEETHCNVSQETLIKVQAWICWIQPGQPETTCICPAVNLCLCVTRCLNQPRCNEATSSRTFCTCQNNSHEHYNTRRKIWDWCSQKKALLYFD